MIVYGVISYILILVMIVGYIVIKKWGDKQEAAEYDKFQDEKNQQQDLSSNWTWCFESTVFNQILIIMDSMQWWAQGLFIFKRCFNFSQI